MERTAGWTSSTDTGPGRASQAPRRVVVGRVRGAHGLRGQLRVQCLGDVSVLQSARRVALGVSEQDPGAETREVEAVAPGREGEVRMRLAGLRRREQAEALRGCLVMLDPAGFEALAPGEYWGYQLVGCRVETREGRCVGRVREIWGTGAQELLVVETPAGDDCLIPAVRALLPEVDVEGRRIVVDSIPGLLDEDQARDRPAGTNC